MYYRCPLNKADNLPPGYSRVPHLHIEHSGNSYNSCIQGPGGQRVWPIEELFARRKFSKNVAERIARLNPYGHEEGSIIRGVFYKTWAKNPWHMDAVKLRDYEKKWGTRDGAEIIHKSGRSKFVSSQAFLRGPTNGS